MSNQFRTFVGTLLITAAILALVGVQPARALGLPPSVPMAPGAFGKTSPKDGATGVSPTPTLSWEASLYATTYEYCAYIGDTCPRAASTSATSVTLSGLTAGTTYHWQVVALDSLRRPTAANGGIVWSFTTGTVPGAFSKSSPTNGTAGGGQNPTLGWTSSAGASYYQYCLSTTSPCSSWYGNVVGISHPLSGLTVNTAYYWDVRAINSWGTTYADGGTAEWHFNTGPGIFNKLTPANGATGIVLNPTLSWGASAGATSYMYCYAPSGPLFPCLLSKAWVEAGAARSVQLNGLSASTTYRWSVRATSNSGTTYADIESWTFRTGDPPGAFSKGGPTNGSIVLSPSPTLTWTASLGATIYYYCYGTTNPCSNWTSAGTNTSAPLSGLSPSTTYYWEVRAGNAFGSTYANGSNTDWSFTTGSKPGAFSKSTPVNGSTVLSPSPTSTWTASLGATIYYYCYGTTNPCSNWTSAGTNTSATLSGLSPSTTYYWEVWAGNAFGSTYANGLNTDWSLTTGALPGAFSKTAPTNNVTGVSLTPTLSWGTSIGATSYEYCVLTSLPSICSWKSVSGSTSVSVTGLLRSTLYRWQVRAVNGFGNTQANTNTWWYFTTGDRPGAFNKTAPANGAINVMLNPTLSWGGSSGVVTYYYCYGTIDPCSNWISAGTRTSAQLSGLSPNTTYFWEVLARNSFGDTYAGGSNADWPFHTVTPLTKALYSISAQDGTVMESAENSNVGLPGQVCSNCPTVKLGDDAANRQFRAILSFQTNNLPANAVIMGVTLMINIYPAGGGGANPFLTLGNIVVDVKKGPFNNNLALEAADFQAVAGKNAVISIRNAQSNGWYSGILGPANYAYLNRAGVTQFRLRFAIDDNNNHIADYLRFYSGDYSIAARRPLLFIRYYMP